MKALELYKQLQNQIPLPIRRPSQPHNAVWPVMATAMRLRALTTPSRRLQMVPKRNTKLSWRSASLAHQSVTDVRSTFSTHPPSTNNLSANLNASSKPDAQPKSLLNVVATTATAPYSTPTQPSKGAEPSLAMTTTAVWMKRLMLTATATPTRMPIALGRTLAPILRCCVLAPRRPTSA